jgi:hypothetical protein
MTVSDWMRAQTRGAPAVLVDRMVEALGANAAEPESGAGHSCLAAAARALEALLSANRFGRESALDLLAIDALTALAFEHAGRNAGTVDEISRFAHRGASTLGHLAAQRV